MVDLLQSNFSTTALLIWGGLLIGGIFGWASERGGFCLRAAIQEWARPNKQTEIFRENSRSIQYLTAVLVAIAGTQLCVMLGGFDPLASIHYKSNASLIALILGGLLFGVGMCLAGGCISRITVLVSRGNLRALWVLLVLSLVAMAGISGILSPMIASIQQTKLPWFPALPQTLVSILILASLVLALAAALLRKSYNYSDMLYGVLIGSLVPAAWIVTSIIGRDDFSLHAPQALSYTQSTSEFLRYLTVFDSYAPSFGVSLLLGTLVGSFLSAFMGGRLFIDGFIKEDDPIRYTLGAIMMGIGGVLSIGCSLGQGLSGISVLAPNALIVLISIMIGAVITLRCSKY